MKHVIANIILFVTLAYAIAAPIALVASRAEAMVTHSSQAAPAAPYAWASVQTTPTDTAAPAIQDFSWVDSLWTNFKNHKWTDLLICLLTLLVGFYQQGKIQPILAKMTPWHKTFALLVVSSCGVMAQALSSGLGWGVALTRAAVPMTIGLVTHFTGAFTTEDAKVAATVTQQAVGAVKEAQAIRAGMSKKASAVIPSATLCLCFVLAALAAIGCEGCSGTGLPPVPSNVVTNVIEDGCALVGILDGTPGAVSAVTVCERWAPVAGPIVTSIINALGGEKKLGEMKGPIHFTPLKHGDKVIGYARAEIAAAVQEKLDAAVAP